MIILPKKSLANSNDDIEQNVEIPVHYYPPAILFFWGGISIIFIINLLISCFWYGPIHLNAYKKINVINEFVKNKNYIKALQHHKALCLEYPKDYASSYGKEIAKICFKCSKHNKSFFKEGLEYLDERDLSTEDFVALLKTVPKHLREKYLSLFNVFYYKNAKDEHFFVLNKNKVESLC